MEVNNNKYILSIFYSGWSMSFSSLQPNAVISPDKQNRDAAKNDNSASEIGHFPIQFFFPYVWVVFRLWGHIVITRVTPLWLNLQQWSSRKVVKDI